MPSPLTRARMIATAASVVETAGPVPGAGHVDDGAGRDLEMGIRLAEPGDPSVDPARGQHFVAFLDLGLEGADRGDTSLLRAPEQEVDGAHHENGEYRHLHESALTPEK